MRQDFIFSDTYSAKSSVSVLLLWVENPNAAAKLTLLLLCALGEFLIIVQHSMPRTKNIKPADSALGRRTDAVLYHL
jgi:hypothetical protein